jgi:hypothetical protein
MRTSNFLATALIAAAAVTVAQAADVDQARVRTAVEKGVAKALEGGPSFVKVSGCISCHNNTLPVMAASLARSRGAAVDQKAEEQQMKTIAAVISGFREPLFEASYTVPDTQVSVPNVLLAYQAEGAPADDLTAAAVHAIAAKQLPNGSWPSYINRAPIENGDIQATALSVRAIQLYGMPGRSAEWKRRIENARDWLVTATAKTTEDKAMLVSGLYWSGASEEQIAQAARVLMNEQRPDGGWAQLATLESDAFATGRALVAMREAGVITPSEEPYQRGVAYLLDTQQADGTWRVKTRAFPFQPLKESGFPHGRDQWISSAATSWAAMALAYAMEPAPIAYAGKPSKATSRR